MRRRGTACWVEVVREFRPRLRLGAARGLLIKHTFASSVEHLYLCRKSKIGRFDGKQQTPVCFAADAGIGGFHVVADIGLPCQERYRSSIYKRYAKAGALVLRNKNPVRRLLAARTNGPLLDAVGM